MFTSLVLHAESLTCCKHGRRPGSDGVPTWQGCACLAYHVLRYGRFYLNSMPPHGLCSAPFAGVGPLSRSSNCRQVSCHRMCQTSCMCNVCMHALTCAFSCICVCADTGCLRGGGSLSGSARHACLHMHFACTFTCRAHAIPAQCNRDALQCRCQPASSRDLDHPLARITRMQCST